MGGRGTFAKGNNVSYRYKTAEVIGGVKVLQPKDPKSSYSLPVESHLSSSYILLDKAGVFRQYREYNSQHEVIFEIGYHFENTLSEQGESVLHVHDYATPGIQNRQRARFITEEELKKYRDFYQVGDLVKGKTLRQFIDDLYYNAEMEFIFDGKKYIISGWINEDGTYTVALHSIEENSQEIFSCTSISRQEVVESFEIAKIFDSKTIYDVEKNIVVTYG